MTWLWIYITGMEWVGIVLIVHALGRKISRFDIKKMGAYLAVYAVYTSLHWYLELPAFLSFISYLFLFGYICWCYRESVFRSLTILVLCLVTVSVIELISTQIMFLIFPIEIHSGILEMLAVTFMVILCFILTRVKFYRILGIVDKWEPSYALVALLSLMIFTPIAMLKVLNKLDVTDYIYIALCILVMWLLVSKIQKYNLENRIRKKYTESFTDIIAQIRRRQHKVKNQFNTAFGLYRLYDTYEELVEKQKEYLGRLWDYELPTDAIILEDPVVVALLYEKINEAIERGIAVETVFSCSLLGQNVSDVIWVQIIGTLLDNAIEAFDTYEGTKKLWIEIEEAKQENAHISLRITNTYRKLRQDELENMFEMGYSTKGTDRGIGLYDVKELVYKCKGELIVDMPEKEEGNCFQINILL